MKKKLEEGLEQLGIELSTEQIQLQLDYLEMLHKWNQAFNLTAINDTESMITLHTLDSLSVYPHIKANNILDVGTGAGLPGIPLAIVFPEKKFTLLDSNGKKTRFLQQAKFELKLNNVTVIHMRMENYQTNHCFDGIISRAVGSLQQLFRETQHLLCQDGQMMLMKGVYQSQDVQDTPGKISIKQLKVPGLDAQRHLVIVEDIR